MTLGTAGSTAAAAGGLGAVLGGIDWRAFRTELRRDTVRELHGFRGPAGPWGGGPACACWPEPYQRPFGSPAFLAELERPVRPLATQHWQHGVLLRAVDADELEQLQASWGERRTAGATIGPIEVPAVGDRDRSLLRAFCTQRGWQRVLVRLFEHVGCKAAHLALSDDALAGLGAVGAAVLAARQRPRLAVLEELLRAQGDSAGALVSLLDRTDVALDALGQHSSWYIERLPGAGGASLPLRNLLRLADREGLVLRAAVGGAAARDCPELPVLSIRSEGDGAGAVGSELLRLLLPVLAGGDQLAFQVGNQGVAADGQHYAGLLAAHRGAEREPAAAGVSAFELLERAFGVASFPEAVIAARTLCVALHEAVRVAAEPVLGELVRTLEDGDRRAREAALPRFVEVARGDRGALRQLWPRYATPVFDEWREHYGERMVDSLAELCREANHLLWELEDIDLRAFDHPLRGRTAERLRESEHLGFRLIELRHLLCLSTESDGHHRRRGRELFQRTLRVRQRWSVLQGACADAVDQVPAGERDASLLARLQADAERLEDEQRALAADARRLVGDVRAHQATWSSPIAPVPEDFVDGWRELFRDYLEPGHYYGQHPWHDPDDELVGVERREAAV